MNNCKNIFESKTTLINLVRQVEVGKKSKAEVINSLEPEIIELLETTSLLTDPTETSIASGLIIEKGATSGRAIFSVTDDKDPLILITETLNEDILSHCQNISGFLLLKEDKSTHRSIYVKSLGIPALTHIGPYCKFISNTSILMNQTLVKENDFISLDACFGNIYLGKKTILHPELFPEFLLVKHWLKEFSKMKIFAGVDLPNEAKKAIEQGADGIDARTEHMFFDTEKLPIFRQALLSTESKTRHQHLKKLLHLQTNDFVKLFTACQGKTVVLRLLDPPSHEFLNLDRNSFSLLMKRLRMSASELKEKMQKLKETNPMVGHRGVRFLLTDPDILDLQTQAIFSAAKHVIQDGVKTDVVIIIPMINAPSEVAIMKNHIKKSYFRIFENEHDFLYRIGIMIETPRIAILSNKIKDDIQYASFGTNDLTAFTFSISRNDAFKKFFHFYIEKNIEPRDPFVYLDDAVKYLMNLAMQKLRAANKKIHVGMCGDQANDVESFLYCKNLGFDSITCSTSFITKALLLAARQNIETTQNTHS